VTNDYRIRGDHAIIYIRRRQENRLLIAIVDAEDIEKIKAIPGSWYVYKAKNQNYYVYGKVNGKVVALHRFVLGFDVPGMKTHVDHVNNDSLDNRKRNLRIVTPSGNHQNRKGASKNSKTGVRGVFWHKDAKKWEVQIKVNGKKAYYKKVDSRKLAERLATKARQEFMPCSKEASHKK